MPQPIYLYNTLTRKKEIFEPLSASCVGLYTCGPTVYNFAHIGNLRTYVFEDILKRVLMYNGLSVKHVMNITDVGHLTSDADEGEDKMEKGARREGKSAWEIADFYTRAFKKDIAELNILPPDIFCKATDNIKEQIELVQKLIDKKFAYETSDGIYFDTTKLPDYGKLANLKNQELKAGARIEIGEKKNPHDFALWKFSPDGEKRQMEWETTFGGKKRQGFPGWHIECSAMSMKFLGEQFDIHCGGIDHVPVHHTNEIAQSEAATDVKPWVKYWLHGEFLNIGNGDKELKMAKSGENFLTLDSLKKRNINPISYRYFLLQAHYRKQLTFSFEALGAAESGLNRFIDRFKLLADKAKKSHSSMADVEVEPQYRKKFLDLMNDDLKIPEAVALMHSLIADETISPQSRLQTLLHFDKVFGLQLLETLDTTEEKESLPEKIEKLTAARATARETKNWKESDRIRDEIAALGYTVEDGPGGQNVHRTK